MPRYLEKFYTLIVRLIFMKITNLLVIALLVINEITQIDKTKSFSLAINSNST